MKSSKIKLISTLLILTIWASIHNAYAGIPMNPESVLFIENNILGPNQKILKKPEPLYKKGLQLSGGGIMHAEKGFKFISVIIRFKEGYDKEITIDLNKIKISSGTKDIRCTTFGIIGMHLRCAHKDRLNPKSTGSFETTGNAYFKKMEWKNNIIKLSGIRSKSVGFEFVFTVPYDFKAKSINWYDKQLTNK